MTVRFLNITVKASAHSLMRWVQLDMEGNPEYEVAWRLFDALKKGVIPDKYGAVHIYIKEEVWAVVTPEFWGGWNIVTFYVPGAKLGDVDNCALGGGNIVN